MISAEFTQHIRFTLQHLFEIHLLEKGPAQVLRLWLNEVNGQSDLPSGQRLHQVLHNAIESMKPTETLDLTLPRHRSYIILKRRYLEGISIQQLEAEFNISGRQFRRENHRAIDELMTVLWNLSPQAARDALQSSPSAEEDLTRLPISDFNRKVGPNSLLDVVMDAAQTLSSIINSSQSQVMADIPADLPPVGADRVALRLAIMKCLRLAIAHSPQRSVGLHAYDEMNAIKLVVDGVQGIHADDTTFYETVQLFTLAEGSVQLSGASNEPAQRIMVRLAIHRDPSLLVVDDDPAMPRIIQRFLGQKPIKVLSCNSTADVTKLVRNAQPMLILLDVLMPTRDGWEILQELKANPDTYHIPLAICSIWDERDLALSLGADLFFQKPIERAEFLECVEKQFSDADF